MSDSTSGDSGISENLEATQDIVNIGASFDEQDLASSIERMFGEAEPDPPSQEEKQDRPPADEGESSDELEGGEAEEVLSQTEEDTDSEQTLDEAEDDEVDDGEESEEGGEEEGKHRDRTVGKLQKRIDKITAKKKEAEALLEQLNAENEKLKVELKSADTKPIVLAPTEDNPYPNLSTEAEVRKEMDMAEQVLDWCDDNPEGGVTTGADGKEIEVSAEKTREIRKRARRALNRHLPDRMKFIQEEQAISSQVEKLFPYWKDVTSSEYQEAQQILRNRPELKKYPNWQADVSIFLMGLQAYKEKIASGDGGKKKAVAKKVVKKAPPAPTPTQAPASKTKSKARSESVRKRFQSERNVDSLASVLATDYI